MKQYTFNDLVAIMVGLTEALNANTAALLGQKPSATSTAETPKPAEVAPADTSGITAEEIQGLVIAVKNRHGASAARSILSSVCGTTSIKKVQPQHYAELVPKLQAKLDEPIEADASADDTDEPEASDTPAVDEGALRSQLDAAITAYIKDDAGETIKAHFEAVKGIISEVGGVVKKADIPADKLQAVIDAVNAANAEDDDL